MLARCSKRFVSPVEIEAASLGVHVSRLSSMGDSSHTMLMSWFILFLAGLLEVVWAVGLKFTEGFSRLWPSVLTLVAMLGSIVLLSYALKAIPLGTAYAVWTGIGAVGVALVGMLIFKEPRTVARVVCILLIVVGIVGLKFYGDGGK